MDRAALRVAEYRFRATFGRRWGSYLALVLLIGLVGVVVLIALGAIVLGNLVAALPARMAARTSTALLSRAE